MLQWVEGSSTFYFYYISDNFRLWLGYDTKDKIHEVDTVGKLFQKSRFLCVIFKIDVQVQLSPFSPHYSSPSHPQSYSLWLCPWDLYIYSLTTLTLFSPLSISSLWLLSVYSLFQSLVLFGSLVCFVDYVPLIGEITWYLFFTTWLISLSIMLSSSICAVAKCRSSSFFLLHSIPLCKCTTVYWSTHLLMCSIFFKK